MTDRDLTAGFASALDNLRPIIFYEGEFLNGTLRLCSEPHTVSWNGFDWLGAGLLLSISRITETTEIKASGFTVALDHCNDQIMALALLQVRQGKPGSVWLGGWDNSRAIVPDPYLAYEGRLDVPEITVGGETGRISINYESRLIDLERPRERRITHEDQQVDYPGDRGREYIASLQEKVLVF